MNKPRSRITTPPGNYPVISARQRGLGIVKSRRGRARTRAWKGGERAAPGWKLRGGPERADRRYCWQLKQRGSQEATATVAFVPTGIHDVLQRRPRRVHKSRWCRIFGCRFCFSTATESPLQLRVQSSRDRHTRAYIYTYHRPSYLYLPRNSRKVKSDSIEPPTCTRKRTYP